MKASCGTSTLPTAFMRFLPSACCHAFHIVSDGQYHKSTTHGDNEAQIACEELEIRITEKTPVCLTTSSFLICLLLLTQTIISVKRLKQFESCRTTLFAAAMVGPHRNTSIWDVAKTQNAWKGLRFCAVTITLRKDILPHGWNGFTSNNLHTYACLQQTDGVTENVWRTGHALHK